MAKFRILIADGLEEIGQSILRAAATVENREGMAPAELLDEVRDCDALIVGGLTKVSQEVFEAASKLKVVGQAGADVDNIDLDAAKKHGAVVVNAPLATTNAVAELAFGLLLALAREIPRADAGMKGDPSTQRELQGVELGGKTLGIIGYGPSGVEVSKWAAAFGMNIVAYDPFVQEQAIHPGGAETVSLQDLFAWSDFISLHLPFDVHSRDLIGPLALSQMKDGVRLICASGGGMIDEEALLSALNSGKVAGAALDFLAATPEVASLLVRHPHVIATPQIGAHTVEARFRAAEDIALEVLAALRGDPLRWRVA